MNNKVKIFGAFLIPLRQTISKYLMLFGGIASLAPHCHKYFGIQDIKLYLILNLEYRVSSVLIGSLNLGYQLIYRMALYGNITF